MKLKLLLFLTVLSITGCSLQELRHEDRPAASRAFGVEEAKEFYEYGKWGGRAFNSAKFNELPLENQRLTEGYLRQLGLYF